MSTPVTLTGRLVSDPEIKFGKTGTAIVRFSVVTSRRVLDKACSQSDCSNRTIARSMCSRHYQVWRWNHSGPLPQPTAEERFWIKVDKGGTVPQHCPEIGNCWIWIRALSKSGYGKVCFEKRYMSAHRLSYELFCGPIPQGLLVLHRCDNPPCVRPEHLSLGTSADNTQDMYRKGRGKTAPQRGERNPRAKLTTTQVEDIRVRFDKGELRWRLADEFGLDLSTVTSLLSGRTWPDAPGPIQRAGRKGRRPLRKAIPT